MKEKKKKKEIERWSVIARFYDKDKKIPMTGKYHCSRQVNIARASSLKLPTKEQQESDDENRQWIQENLNGWWAASLKPGQDWRAALHKLVMKEQKENNIEGH